MVTKLVNLGVENNGISAIFSGVLLICDGSSSLGFLVVAFFGTGIDTEFWLY